MAAYVKNNNDYNDALLTAGGQSELEFVLKDSINNIQNQDYEIYLVASGMSSLPVTVKFE